MSGAFGILKIQELRKRLLFVVLMLAVYRLGVHVPTPGIDGVALQQVFKNMQSTLFGIFNLFSGGALQRFSIFALGVMPYISSSIIFQLLTVAWPYLHELQKEGEHGRKKITQYTRYGTVLLAMIQSYGIAAGLEQLADPPVVLHPGMGFRMMTMVTLTTGTILLMWIGEQMSERGIGNGVSLLIASGIAAGIPSGIGNTFSLYRSNQFSFFAILILLGIVVLTFFCIIYVERAARRIPIQYAKRVIGRKVYGGQNTNLPIKVNPSGVIPPIFASSLIMFPTTIATFVHIPLVQMIVGQLSPGSLMYEVVFVALIIFFCYFYSAVTFKTEDIAENLKKHGGFIPGIRPGTPTAEYMDFVLSRIVLGGAIYISAICVLPTIMSQYLKVPFYFGGTSVLILVGVGLDTVAQIETFLLSRNYEGFMKHTKLKGRMSY